MKKNFIYVMFVVIGAVCVAGCSPSTEELIQDLYSEDSYTRATAARDLMRRHGDETVVPQLIEVIRGDNEQAKFIAAQILGSMADTTAVEPLCSLLDHENEHIRIRAAWSLGSIGHQSALPCLEKALQDEDPDVRYRAVISLGFMHVKEALPPIYEMFRDPADSVRAAAIQSLYYYRSETGYGVSASDLAVTLNDPSEQVRYVAVQALGGLADTAMAGKLLVEALDDESKWVRMEAIKSIGRLHYEEAVPVLKDMYDLATIDEEVAISETVETITGETFPPPLEGGNQQE